MTNVNSNRYNEILDATNNSNNLTNEELRASGVPTTNYDMNVYNNSILDVLERINDQMSIITGVQLNKGERLS